MRISDWSSDVCSSDLLVHHRQDGHDPRLPPLARDRENAVGRQVAAVQPEHLGNPQAASVHQEDDREIAGADPWWLVLAHGRIGFAHQLGGLALAERARHRARQTRSPDRADRGIVDDALRSEEHTSELQSLMRNSYAVFCLKKK